MINLPDLLVAGDSLQIRTTLFQNRIKDEIFRTRSVSRLLPPMVELFCTSYCSSISGARQVSV